jgi:F-type H+-transporting ATPase subunit delta
MPTDRNLLIKEAAVYAEVLLDAAKGEGIVFEVSGQLELLLSGTRASIELRTTLADEGIAAQARTAIVTEIFSGVSEIVLKVVNVMFERNDFALLARVSEKYLELAEAELNAIFVDVTTVIALDDQLRQGIKAKYSAQLGKDILLFEHIDPSIVGGIVLSTHGRRIDASVISQLENARNVLSTVPSGGDR